MPSLPTQSGEGAEAEVAKTGGVVEKERGVAELAEEGDSVGVPFAEEREGESGIDIGGRYLESMSGKPCWRRQCRATIQERSRDRSMHAISSILWLTCG